MSSLARLLYAILPYAGNLSSDLRITSAAMIAANLVAIAGAVFFQWDAFHIMFLFWCESVMIGIFNIGKMLLSGWSPRDGNINHFFAFISLFLSAFFLVHFNGFNAGHFVFLLAFANMSQQSDGSLDLSVIEQWTGIQFLTGPVSLISGANTAVILSILISHLISFAIHDIKNKEPVHLTPMDYMFKPYKRIIVMHITILAGAFVYILMLSVLGASAGVAFLAVFIILKLVMDLREHMKSHTKIQDNEANERTM